jgi:hypothetical protein
LNYTFQEAFGDMLDEDLGFQAPVEESLVAGADSDTTPPPKSLWVSGSDIEILEFDLQSLFVPKEVVEKYKGGHFRLKKELQ